MPALEMLSEPICITDTFASGMAAAEDLGEGLMRFTFYARQQSIYGGEEFVIVARIVMPTTATLAAIRTTMRCIRAHGGSEH